MAYFAAEELLEKKAEARFYSHGTVGSRDLQRSWDLPLEKHAADPRFVTLTTQLEKVMQGEWVFNTKEIEIMDGQTSWRQKMRPWGFCYMESFPTVGRLNSKCHLQKLQTQVPVPWSHTPTTKKQNTDQNVSWLCIIKADGDLMLIIQEWWQRTNLNHWLKYEN